MLCKSDTASINSKIGSNDDNNHIGGDDNNDVDFSDLLSNIKLFDKIYFLSGEKYTMCTCAFSWRG